MPPLYYGRIPTACGGKNCNYLFSDVTKMTVIDVPGFRVNGTRMTQTTQINADYFCENLWMKTSVGIPPLCYFPG
jgi:hypothetical protein